MLFESEIFPCEDYDICATVVQKNSINYRKVIVCVVGLGALRPSGLAPQDISPLRGGWPTPVDHALRAIPNHLSLICPSSVP